MAPYDGIDEALERARAINVVLREIGQEGALVVGFPSRALIPDAYGALRRLGLRDRWYESTKEWTRRTVVFEAQAYELLWPHVELEFWIEGRVQFFFGNGSKRHRGSPIDAMRAARLPIYWQIRLHDHVDRFRGLIDHDD